VLSDEELKGYPEPTPLEVVPHYVARYWDLMALARAQPARVIGPEAKLRDRPGFEVDLITRGSIDPDLQSCTAHRVLMPMRGHGRLSWEEGETILNPGDTCLLQPGLAHALTPSMTGEASLYRVTATIDPAGAPWVGCPAQ